MKSFYTLFALLLCMAFSSCEIVGGIFKAGMGFGIFIVVLVLGLIVYLFTRRRK